MKVVRKALILVIVTIVTLSNWGCPKDKKETIPPLEKCSISKMVEKQSDLFEVFSDAMSKKTLTLDQCNQFKKDYQTITYDILECEEEGYESIKTSARNMNDKVQKYDCSVMSGGVPNSDGGSNPGGNATGEIAFRNITRTHVTATVGGKNVTLTPVAGGINGYVGDPWGAFYAIKGTPGKSISLQNARTVGLGGEVVHWQDQAYVYPEAGKTTYVDFNVPSQYFLVIITSSNPLAPLPSGDLSVNYGLSSQTNEKWTSNTNLPQYFGYYKAFTNSKVRFVTTKGTKEWSNLDLKFTVNQVVSLRH